MRISWRMRSIREWPYTCAGKILRFLSAETMPHLTKQDARPSTLAEHYAPSMRCEVVQPDALATRLAKHEGKAAVLACGDIQIAAPHTRIEMPAETAAYAQPSAKPTPQSQPSSSSSSPRNATASGSRFMIASAEQTRESVARGRNSARSRQFHRLLSPPLCQVNRYAAEVRRRAPEPRSISLKLARWT